MEITTLLVFLVVLLLIALVGVVFFLSNRKSDDTSVKVLENSLSHLREMMANMEHKVLSGEREMRQTVDHRLDSANKLIREITAELTEVKEGNKQVLNMTEQLSNLEKVLTNQKQRGNWGESSLELILSNFLPNHYEMQYMFKNGEAVDAVIKIKDKFLPIDSKFSLDNYQRCVDAENEDDKKYYADEFKKDLKLRIQETSKYIRENEDTLPIAFMFIPSEAIYYDLLAGEQSRIKVNTQSLMEFAQKSRVFIVSPTSIIAYIHLVLSGIKAFNLEKDTEQIKKKVEDLGRHIVNYEEFYKKLGSSLSTTVNHYTKGYDELRKIDKDVYKITDGIEGGKVEVLKIEKPNFED